MAHSVAPIPADTAVTNCDDTEPANAGARSDEQLLRAFLDGDRASLAELAHRHERALLGLARGLLNGDPELACDAIQETWIRVIRHGGKFRGRSSFRTWVYRIAINRCRDLQSRQTRLDRRRADANDGASGSSLPDAHGHERLELQAAVAALGQAHREVVLLCYHRSMTHERAADVLSIPVGTLKSRLNAALGILRQRLRTDGES